ncbi:MAG: DNA gyrase subunit A, partial [Bacteroidetes bacterium GWE2_29_8]
IVLRSVTNIEQDEKTDKIKIIVTEIPYQVNKSELIKKIADLINDKKIEGISDIRDESDRNGMRIVFDIKRDAIPNIVLNNLFQHTQLQNSFNINNVALVKGRPMMLNLKDLIREYVEHRHEVVIRRTQYELKKAKERAHILEGLLIALDHLDEVIKLIRASQTPEIARNGLMETYELSEIQARAILDLRLQKLTGLERDGIIKEYNEIKEKIDFFTNILEDEVLRMTIIKDELLEMKEKYGDDTRTEIEYTANDIRIEDTIADDPVVITISHLGYIKRTLLNEYRTQHKGGRGSIGSSKRDDDFIEYMFIATMHNYLLFFTEKGKCFWLRVYEIPEGSKQSKGRAIQNMINIPSDDKVKAFINVKDLHDKEYVKEKYIIFSTLKGLIKKTSLEAYSRPRQGGIAAININEGDQLLEAKMTNGQAEVMLAIKSGRAIRFNESAVRAMGRTATGVIGIRLKNKEEDEVIGMICVEDMEKETILVVSENGYGKRTKLEDYRVTHRGGKGVKTINVTEKTGSLIAIKNVIDSDDLMIINKSGIIIRIKVESLRVIGRATQGVRLINLKGDDCIAAVTKVQNESGEELDDDNDIPIDDSIIGDQIITEENGTVNEEEEEDDDIIEDEDDLNEESEK